MFSDERLIAAFSRGKRNMSLNHPAQGTALANRKGFLGRLGIDYRLLACAKQVHASTVRYAREDDRGKGAISYEDAIAETDAFITDKKNVPLAIFTADCLPVFLFDPKKPCIGLVHAGWKSTREGITAKAIRLMQEKFQSRPEDISVGFGPCIRECCYEVGEEFKAYFPRGLKQREARFYLDLIEVNKLDVLRSGVREENISDAGICTSCRNEEFFSFRKLGKDCGRMMSVAMLK